MEISKKTLVILAGGLGSRFNGLKQAESILENDASIMEYSVYDAMKAGFNKFVFIINRSLPENFKNKISEILDKFKVEYHWINQELSDFVEDEKLLKNRTKPWGTGHAVLCASKVVNENFLVINADDFYGKTNYEIAFQLLSDTQNSLYQTIAYPLKFTTSKNGSVSRGICILEDQINLKSVNEVTQIFDDEKEIYSLEENKKVIYDPETLVSMNFWILSPSIFDFLLKGFNTFLDKNPDEKSEFYLPFQIDQLLRHNKIAVHVEVSREAWKGITYPADKAELRLFLLEKIKQKQYPEKLWN